MTVSEIKAAIDKLVGNDLYDVYNHCCTLVDPAEEGDPDSDVDDEIAKLIRKGK